LPSAGAEVSNQIFSNTTNVATMALLWPLLSNFMRKRPCICHQKSISEQLLSPHVAGLDTAGLVHYLELS